MPRIYTHDDVMTLLTEHISRAGSARKLAAKVGVSGAYLSGVLRGRKTLGTRILTYLGLTPVTVYTSEGDKD